MKGALKAGLFFTFGLLALLLVSCKRSPGETVGSTSGGSGTSNPSDAKWNPNVTLDEVAPVKLEAGRKLKPDNHVVEPTTVFQPKDTIHVVLVSNGSANGVKIRVFMTFQDGSGVFDSSRVVDLHGPTATAFDASKPGGWPAGRYQARLLINDRSYGTWDFEVR